MSRFIAILTLLLCPFFPATYWCFADPVPQSDVDVADLGRLAFRVFSDKDGLPQNTIQAIVFDHNDYLWVATQDGAAYYDGHQWAVVNMPNRTISNDVRAMLVGSDGSIWFGTAGGGLSRLKEGSWTTFDTSLGLPNNWVRSLLETTSQNGTQTLWVGTDNGLALLENGKWTIYDSGSGLPNGRVYSMLETASQNGARTLWVGTKGGLARFENGKWTTYDTRSGLPDNWIRSLLETTSREGTQTLWAGTDGGGLARFENGKWTIYDTRSGLPNNSVFSLLETVSKDGTHSLWAGTNGGGLARFEDGRWITYDTRSGLPHNGVWSLAESPSKDGTHILWAGTNGSGLARLEQGRWIAFDTRSGLPNNSVWGMVESTSQDGTQTLWVATDGGGLARLEQGKWTIYDTRSGLPNNVVRSLLETTSNDGRQTLWAGTFGGLARLEQGRWTIYDIRSGLPDNGVLSLLETTSQDGERTLWVGTFGGLARLEKGKWTTYDTRSGLPNNGVWSLLETTSNDGTRTLWVGTNGGLARLENGKWTIYDTRSGLPNNSVWSLREITSQNGARTLWVGTNGGGVSILDLTSKNAKWVTLSDATRPALPNNVIYQIREDAKKRVYIFTIKGIARLTPHNPTPDDSSEYSIYTFTTEDGLPSNECNHGASIIDSKGRIWVGTVEGAAIFDPSKEFEDRLPKPLRIERTLLGGKERALPQNDTLAYNENSLSFEYALLSYFRESDTRYRTQLVGLDEEPSKWTTDYKRDYTTLPEGNYTFKVWGIDYAGNISGPVEVAFRISPAPWRTWWAYLLYLGSLAFIGYGGVRLRLQTLRRRTEMLEAKVIERTAELAKKNEELAKKNEELIRSKEELIQSHKRVELIFSALSDVLPGTVLDEKYRLESKIGAGGFGAVYRATHLSLNRPVAVKIFRPASGNVTTESLERFRLEGVSTCRVNHPNAVSILDFGVSNEGIAYLVMELLQGRTLAIELREKGRLSPERCAEILIPVCDALSKAHAAGIVHRDIKPDNIFLHRTVDGEVVKVVDFGIAKLLGDTSSLGAQSLTGTGGLIGTPVYMSPERLADRPYDGRSDVYSLGIMLYQMLCGRVPFRSEDGSFWAVALMHLNEEPRPLREFNPSVPAAVEEVVMRTLTKDPEERPTARELAKEFAMALGIELHIQNSGGFRFTLEGQSGISTAGWDETPTVLIGTQQTADVPGNTSDQTLDTGQLTEEPTRIFDQGSGIRSRESGKD